MENKAFNEALKRLDEKMRNLQIGVNDLMSEVKNGHGKR